MAEPTSAGENNKQNEKDIEKIIKNFGYNKIKDIGVGGFGAVKEVEKKGKHFAIKVMIKKANEEKVITEKVKEFRGPNIVKIMFEKIKEENYYLYVMEHSYIGDLSKFDKFLYKYLIFKEPFIEKVGNNLIRALTQQMVSALKTLYLGNLVHFDIKPNNMLIFENLTLKLIDFSLLKKLANKEDEIPGGTFGYRTPESYEHKTFDINDLRKQDYFAIGMTIYFLKYGKSPFSKSEREKNKNNNQKINKYHNVDFQITLNTIEQALYKIKTRKYQDKDFTNFLCNLIQLKPKDRFDFAQIVRDKWLNKNSKEIQKIFRINQLNEDNIILELQKSDFLINNTQYYRKKKFDVKFNNEKENKKYKQIKKGKFKFGKRN